MPAITIWAPWGSLIAHGFKSIETRSHDRFRSLQGHRIAIHQARRCANLREVLRVTRHVGASRAAGWLVSNSIGCPTGAVVATAFVASVRWLDGSIEDNIAACCVTDGTFGLELDKVCALDIPVYTRGHQGIWEWDGHDPYTRQGTQHGAA